MEIQIRLVWNHFDLKFILACNSHSHIHVLICKSSHKAQLPGTYIPTYLPIYLTAYLPGYLTVTCLPSYLLTYLILYCLGPARYSRSKWTCWRFWKTGEPWVERQIVFRSNNSDYSLISSPLFFLVIFVRVSLKFPKFQVHASTHEARKKLPVSRKRGSRFGRRRVYLP